MKNSEIKELTHKELVEALSDETLNFTKMKMAHAVNPIDSPAKIRAQRKLIARLKTDIKRRQIEQQAEQTK